MKLLEIIPMRILEIEYSGAHSRRIPKFRVYRLTLLFLLMQLASCSDVDMAPDAHPGPFENNISNLDELAGVHECIKDRALGTTKFGDCAPLFDTLRVAIGGGNMNITKSDNCETVLDAGISYHEGSNSFLVKNDSGYPIEWYEFRRVGGRVQMQERAPAYDCGFQCELKPASGLIEACGGK